MQNTVIKETRSEISVVEYANDIRTVAEGTHLHTINQNGRKPFFYETRPDVEHTDG